MEFRLLGPVQLRVDGNPVDTGPPRQLAVLTALVVDANHPVLLDALIDRVWGDAAPQRARHVLYAYIARIRGVLRAAGADAVLQRRSGGYQLEIAPERIDVHRFRSLLDRSRQPHVSDMDSAELLDQALSLWEGTPLGGLKAEWADRVREGWHLQRIEAAGRLAQLQLRLGRAEAVIGPLTTLSGTYPLVESLVAMLMRALAAAGRTAEALDRYAQFRRLLADELGADPGPELQGIHQNLLLGTPCVHPPAATFTPAQLPLAPNGFVGRTAQLAQLDTTGPVTVVSGMAGAGKTALAVHWAHRVAERFTGGQLYLNLCGFDPVRPPIAPADAMHTILEALGLPTADLPTGLAGRTARYHALLTGRQVLLVLDNVRDVEQVRPLLPAAAGCLAIVTSRSPLLGLVATEGATLLRLDVLSTSDARELLAARIGADRLAAEPAAVEEIVARCGRLPLALAIVAARAAEHPAFRLADLTAELRSGLDALDGGDAASDIRSVFDSSYRLLAEPSARLFRLLGLHPGGDITPAAAAALAGTPVSRCLAELTRAHLLSERLPGRHSFHDLVRVYATELAEGLESARQRADARRRLLDYYLHTAFAAAARLHLGEAEIALPAIDPAVVVEQPADPLDWFHRERAGLLRTIELAAADPAQRALVWPLAWSTRIYLDRFGYFEDLVRVQEAGLAAARRAGDLDRMLFSHRTLGRAFARLGDARAAGDHFRQALQLCAELGDVVNEAKVLCSLAWMIDQEGDRDTAISYGRRAVRLFEWAGHRRGQARALSMTGWFLVQEGVFDEATELFQWSMALSGAAQDSANAASGLDGLGLIQLRQGNPAAAVELIQRALDLAVRATDRYTQVATLTRLAEAHQALGHDDEALSARRQAVAILDQLDHPRAIALRETLLADRPLVRTGRTAPAAVPPAPAAR